MKFLKVSLLFLLIIAIGCQLARRETERTIHRDTRRYIDGAEGSAQIELHIKEFVDENFEEYSETYHKKRSIAKKEKIKWTLTVISVTISIIAGGGGLIVKLRKKKNE
jgi:hypothetical protein